MPKGRAYIFVSGTVQAVFFRQSTKEKADELGIFGWVKNIFDGRVEAVFEGEKEKIEKIIEWAKIGPPLARVDNVSVEWEECKNEFNKFEIIS